MHTEIDFTYNLKKKYPCFVQSSKNLRVTKIEQSAAHLQFVIKKLINWAYKFDK